MGISYAKSSDDAKWLVTRTMTPDEGDDYVTDIWSFGSEQEADDFMALIAFDEGSDEIAFPGIP